MKADHERVTKLLTDTVTLLCKNGLSYDHELKIQGLLGITVDSSDVFLIPINDTFNGSSSSSTLTPVPSPVATSTATSSVQTRNHSGSDDIVDLTRLVETPNVPIGVRPSSMSSMHHGAPARPRSVGSVSQTRSHLVAGAALGLSHLTSKRHLQAVARQPHSAAVVTCEHYGASSVRRVSAERLPLAADQHNSALALAMHPGQRPRARYNESMHNLMMVCDRQMAPNSVPRGQGHQQVPPGQTGARQRQHTTQHRHTHQNVIGSVSGAAEDTLQTVGIGRPGAEHFTNPPHLHRRPMPGDACARRSDANLLHMMHTSTAVPGVGPPPTMSRSHHPDMSRPAYHDAVDAMLPILPWHVVGNLQQVQSAAEGRQLANSTTHYRPPAKRHAPNHPPTQVMQPYNSAIMHSHSHLPPSYDYNQHTHLSLPCQQTASVTDPYGPLSQAASISTSQSVCVTSSLDIKPLSSPVQPGRRSRSRHVEHIDLCDDDETADNEVNIPVSSIVIQPQPDNTDLCASVPDEAERSNIFMNTSDVRDIEFQTAVDNIFSENDLPQLTHIHEIVPLDDGLDNEDGEVSLHQNRVTTDNTGHSTSASFSVSSATSGSCDQSSALDSSVSGAQLDITGDQHSTITFSHNQIGVNSGLPQLSPDESRQMAQLYFSAEET